MTATGIDAVLLSGGSLFGLDAAGGAVSLLREQGRGMRIGTANVPIAVQAISFDLLNGGNKDWGRMPPYWELGWQATAAASADLRARHCRRRLRRHHRHAQGRARLGQHRHRLGLSLSAPSSSSMPWIGSDRRRSALLGRALRGRRRVRRPGPAGAACHRGA